VNRDIDIYRCFTGFSTTTPRAGLYGFTTSPNISPAKRHAKAVLDSRTLARVGVVHSPYWSMGGRMLGRKKKTMKMNEDRQQPVVQGALLDEHEHCSALTDTGAVSLSLISLVEATTFWFHGARWHTQARIQLSW
jgi:hypothetical protein